VTGWLLANFACEEGRPFFLLDVPQSPDGSALAYLTAQMQDLIERWTTELRIPFDPDWMHLRPSFLADFLYHLEDNLGVVIAFEEASAVWWDSLDEEEPVRSLARKVLSNPMNGPVERRVDITLQHIARYRCRRAIHFSH
jgi:hypothetical protein